MKLKAVTGEPSEKNLGQLFVDVIHKAFADAVPVDDGGKLAEFMGSLSEDYKRARKEAAELTKEQAEQKVQEIIDGITLDRYKAAIKNKTWPWDDRPNREGYSSYLNGIIRNMDFVALVNIHDIQKKKITGWIKANIDRAYPPPEYVGPLPKQPSHVNRFISPTNLLMHDLVNKPLVNAGGLDLPVMPKENITTFVMVTYEGNEAMAPFNLTTFERRVMDAVCSLYHHATAIMHYDYLVFTPESVYRAMPGSGAKLNKDMREKIVAAIEKLSSIRVDLDATSELRQAKKIEGKATFIRKQNILYTKGGEYKHSNGKVVTAWQLLDIPVIYDYAEKMGQLANVSAKYANIEGFSPEGEPDGQPLKMSDERRGLVEVMLRRAVAIQRAQREAVRRAAWKTNANAEKPKTWREIMTAPKAAGGLQTSDIMRFDKTFEAAGIGDVNRATAKKHKDFCRHVWKYWEKTGFIHGFQEVKERGADAGLQMLFKATCMQISSTTIQG